MPISNLLLAPLLLLAPVSAASVDAGPAGPGLAAGGPAAQPRAGLGDSENAVRSAGELRGPIVFTVRVSQSVQEPARQVRIEQQTTIRVVPRAARRQLPPSMFAELPQDAMEPQYIERKIGKCLPISGIAGVQAEGRDRLLLFMRDRRIVSAALERACRSRDFYSGFYVAPSADGQICVDRDTLLSRSGANCKLTRIRQLVLSED